jgi:hypothetical protein
VFGALLVAGGCAEDQPSSPAEAFCSGYCELAKRCALIVKDCVERCENDRPGLSKLSIEGAKRVGDCIAGLDCGATSIDAEWTAKTQACFDSARVGLPPTAHVRAFCAQFAEAWFECGQWLSTSDCESNYGMWSDPMVDEFAACEREADCEAFATCVQTTAGGS